MECARLKNWHFWWNRRENPSDWSWMVDTQATYIPFGVNIYGKLKKRA